MIIPLPDTTTRSIAKKLVEAQEHYTLTTGRVLTLIVVAHMGDDLEAILSSVRDASHEHPSRVLVVVSGETNAETRLDAQLRVGGEAGASEMVIMRLQGALANQAEAVVTPLLLPDTPLVAWWPTACPPRPCQHPVGTLAQRRITNVAHDEAADHTALHQLSSGYAPGDSDMTWASITLWRGIVASALDRHPHEDVQSVEISGPADSPAADIAAGWLVDRLAVPVYREVSKHKGADCFPIHKLVFRRETSPIRIEVLDNRSLRVEMPGSPESIVAISVRSQAEVLSEELRHLDTDDTYARALRALGKVNYS